MIKKFYDRKYGYIILWKLNLTYLYDNTLHRYILRVCYYETAIDVRLSFKRNLINVIYVVLSEYLYYMILKYRYLKSLTLHIILKIYYKVIIKYKVFILNYAKGSALDGVSLVVFFFLLSVE